jgi:hypothetical protein
MVIGVGGRGERRVTVTHMRDESVAFVSVRVPLR